MEDTTGFTPPTAQDLADYDEYLASLPKHGDGPKYDDDQPDTDLESLPWPQSALDGEGFPY